MLAWLKILHLVYSQVTHLSKKKIISDINCSVHAHEKYNEIGTCKCKYKEFRYNVHLFEKKK